MKRIYIIIILFSIALVSLSMHYKYFSKDLISVHVWRQTQTQSTIINFYEESMNIFNPLKNERGNGDGIFRMEFPLMQWLVAILYKIFGNHLIISRIFMFIVGLFSIAGTYKLIKEIFNNRTIAIIGAWAFNFSPCFFYYTINPLPDNFALCCSIWGLAFFFSWIRKIKNFILLLSCFFLSIGALCKLPFIIYFVVPLVFFLQIFLKNKVNKKNTINVFILFSFIILPLAWYLYVVPSWQGNGIVGGVLDNNVSFPKTLFYLKDNLFSVLPEMLLNYGSVFFFIMGFYFLFKNKSYKNQKFPLLLALSLSVLAYFLFEINMITNVHDYYLFPFLPILFILVCFGAYNLLNLRIRFFKYFTVLLLLILPLTTYLRMKIRWNEDKPGFNKDLLIYKNELKNAVPKSALCVVGNDISHFIFFYYIDKKGWGFNNDELNATSLKNMIENGAKYLYSDSRRIDTKAELQPFIDKLILEKNSIRIYSLKN